MTAAAATEYWAVSWCVSNWRTIQASCRRLRAAPHHGTRQLAPHVAEDPNLGAVVAISGRSR